MKIQNNSRWLLTSNLKILTLNLKFCVGQLRDSRLRNFKFCDLKFSLENLCSICCQPFFRNSTIIFNAIPSFEKIFMVSYHNLGFKISSFRFDYFNCCLKDFLIHKELYLLPIMNVISQIKSLTACTCLIKEWGIARI